MRITTLDTTLRAGLEAEGVSLSLEDKLAIAAKLDEFGIDLIEADASDLAFLQQARPNHARIAAWIPGEAFLSQASSSGVPVAVVSFVSAIPALKAAGRNIIFHAEHFFDRFRDNPTLALHSLEAASGADVLCLCDTRGGTLPRDVTAACTAVRERFDGVLGIRAHNDTDVAVANTIAAVECGFTHIEGSINGYGPRCGVANLGSLIGDLMVKLGHTLSASRLESLTEMARFIAEIANLGLRSDQPYVGRNAFPVHATGWEKAFLPPANLDWHACPCAVGNLGRTILDEAQGLPERAMRELLEQCRQLESEGYELEAADGTRELLIRLAIDPSLRHFEPVSREVTVRASEGHSTVTHATVTLEIAGARCSAGAYGQGPVDALAACLRQCLGPRFRGAADLKLTDYKVRMLDPQRGTEARARALIGWTGRNGSFLTTGVSADVVQASWLALVDAFRLEIVRCSEPAEPAGVSAQYGWGV